jgi:hypothetical protein
MVRERLQGNDAEQDRWQRETVAGLATANAGQATDLGSTDFAQ